MDYHNSTKSVRLNTDNVKMYKPSLLPQAFESIRYTALKNSEVLYNDDQLASGNELCMCIINMQEEFQTEFKKLENKVAHIKTESRVIQIAMGSVTVLSFLLSTATAISTIRISMM